MDPVQLIRHDHQQLERLFKRIEHTIAGDDPRARAEALRQVTRELSIHTAIEEQFLYPALRAARPEDVLLQAIEEHHATKVILSELQATPVEDPRFASKVRLLVREVRAHVEEEERELLPSLEKALPDDQLRELGAALANAKLLSPTRPHPTAPEQPPGNLVAGPAVGVIDRLRDGLRDAVLALRGGIASGVETLLMLVRRLSTQAERRGREAVDDLAARTRIVATEARDAGRRTFEDAAGRGAEAAKQLRAPARRAARAARAARREGRKAGTRRQRRTA
jgi:hemerythrin superfamily protein